MGCWNCANSRIASLPSSCRAATQHWPAHTSSNTDLRALSCWGVAGCLAWGSGLLLVPLPAGTSPACFSAAAAASAAREESWPADTMWSMRKLLGSPSSRSWPCAAASSSNSTDSLPSLSTSSPPALVPDGDGGAEAAVVAAAAGCCCVAASASLKPSSSSEILDRAGALLGCAPTGAGVLEGGDCWRPFQLASWIGTCGCAGKGVSWPCVDARRIRGLGGCSWAACNCCWRRRVCSPLYHLCTSRGSRAAAALRHDAASSGCRSACGLQECSGRKPMTSCQRNYWRLDVSTQVTCRAVCGMSKR
jgi:hypothetical protein